MGWFDGNPAHLWEHPPTETAKRFAADYGGTDALVAKGRSYAEEGDLRFAATLLNHAVFAEPGHTGAREALADVYDRLGHGAENATWRNFYLTGAMELRGTTATAGIDLTNPELAMALTVGQIIDSLAIRIDGPRAWDTTLTMAWHLTDHDRTWHLALSNGALTYRTTAGAPPPAPAADLTLALDRPRLFGVLAGQGLDGVTVQGDPGTLERLVALLDTPDPNFPIVTP